MYTLYLYTENPELKSLYIEKMKSSSRGDAGIDLYVPDTIEESDTTKTLFLDHQIICLMTKETMDMEVPVSYYLYPRSSISKTPYRLANSVGIIDSGYRGNIIAALDCIRNIQNIPYTLEKFQRIVQICAPTLEPVQLVVCDSKEEMNMNTERSTGGFGSSGK
jgi:dUTP pyrophosphatase